MSKILPTLVASLILVSMAFAISVPQAVSRETELDLKTAFPTIAQTGSREFACAVSEMDSMELIFRYTGQPCGASQENPKLLKCFDFYQPEPDIEKKQKEIDITVMNSRFTQELQVWPEVVSPNGDFSIRPMANVDSFQHETVIEIRVGPYVRQQIHVDIACIDPSTIGERFGSLLLIGVIPRSSVRVRRFSGSSGEESYEETV